MPQHITVVLGNGSRNHFHGEVMYDDKIEKILVIEEAVTKATVHFNPQFVAAWVTSDMLPDEADALRQLGDQALSILTQIRAANEEDEDDDPSIF